MLLRKTPLSKKLTSEEIEAKLKDVVSVLVCTHLKNTGYSEKCTISIIIHFQFVFRILLLAFSVFKMPSRHFQFLKCPVSIFSFKMPCQHIQFLKCPVSNLNFKMPSQYFQFF